MDTTPIAPALAAFFDDVLSDSVSQLNFRTIVDGLGGVLFKYPFRCEGGGGVVVFKYPFRCMCQGGEGGREPCCSSTRSGVCPVCARVCVREREGGGDGCRVG